MDISLKNLKHLENYVTDICFASQVIYDVMAANDVQLKHSCLFKKLNQCQQYLLLHFISPMKSTIYPSAPISPLNVATN